MLEHHHRRYPVDRHPNRNLLLTSTTALSFVCLYSLLPQNALGFVPPISYPAVFRHGRAHCRHRPPSEKDDIVRLLSSSWPSILIAEGDDANDKTIHMEGIDDVALSELKNDVIIEMNESSSSSNMRGEDSSMGGAGDENRDNSPPLLQSSDAGMRNRESVETNAETDANHSDEFLKEKRVPITIRYSGQVSGLRSFYLTAAKKITLANPDVIVERMILPAVEGESVFEVLVDGRVVIGKGRSKWQSVSRNGNGGPANSGMSVFISMQEVNAAIAKARRKRRPSTAYVRGGAEEGDTPAVRLEMLKVGRNGKEEQSWENPS